MAAMPKPRRTHGKLRRGGDAQYLSSERELTRHTDFRDHEFQCRLQAAEREKRMTINAEFETANGLKE